MTSTLDRVPQHPLCSLHSPSSSPSTLQNTEQCPEYIAKYIFNVPDKLCNVYATSMGLSSNWAQYICTCASDVEGGSYQGGTYTQIGRGNPHKSFQRRILIRFLQLVFNSTRSSLRHSGVRCIKKAPTQ